MKAQAFTDYDCARALPHRGEVLREDYRAPLGLTAGLLAKAMGLPDHRTRIARVARERQPVTPDTALRLEGCSAPWRGIG
jgi:addiction module HigA family antidote